MRSNRSKPLALSSSYFTLEPDGISITLSNSSGSLPPGVTSCQGWIIRKCSPLFHSTRAVSLRLSPIRKCGAGAHARELPAAQLRSSESQQGSIPLPEILRPETLALFTRRQPAPPGTSRALGWDTPSSPSQSGKYFSPQSFGHLGYTGTSLWIDPERQLSIILLTNRTWPDCSNQAIKQIRPRFHDAIVEALP